MAEGERPVPSRTRKLSPPAPMVLHSPGCGRVGRRRHQTSKSVPTGQVGALFFVSSPTAGIALAIHGRRGDENGTPTVTDGNDKRGDGREGGPRQRAGDRQDRDDRRRDRRDDRRSGGSRV